MRADARPAAHAPLALAEARRLECVDHLLLASLVSSSELVGFTSD
jgi:hypothetical protein